MMQNTIRVDKVYPVLRELPQRTKKEKVPEKERKKETFQDVLEQIA